VLASRLRRACVALASRLRRACVALASRLLCACLALALRLPCACFALALRLSCDCACFALALRLRLRLRLRRACLAIALRLRLCACHVIALCLRRADCIEFFVELISCHVFEVSIEVGVLSANHLFSTHRGVIKRSGEAAAIRQDIHKRQAILRGRGALARGAGGNRRDKAGRLTVLLRLRYVQKGVYSFEIVSHSDCSPLLSRFPNISSLLLFTRNLALITYLFSLHLPPFTLR
jgi:hypothetical protein